jgi:phospholipid transport system substrate-binding protein
MKTLIWIFAFIFGSGGILVPTSVPKPGEPTAVMRATFDQVLVIVRKPGSETNAEHRYQAIWDVLYSRFAPAEMARRTLATHWKDRSPEEREEFIDLFVQLLFNAYVKKVEEYLCDTVEWSHERIRGTHAEVRTKIFNKGRSISVDYRMIESAGGWRVYDVVIEGVSLVGNYRTQFHRIITASGYGALVDLMRKKQRDRTKREIQLKG